MYYEPDVDRLRKLTGLTKQHIGHSILFCPKCNWQLEPLSKCKPICPECATNLHISKIDQELLDLIAFAGDL